jgi:hypothetical protein
LKFETEVVIPRLTAFEAFNDTTSDDEIKNAFNNMIATAKEDNDKRNMMFKCMSAYAVKNDFPKPLDK